MPRSSFVVAAALGATLALASVALADFAYVRSIPAPNIPCYADQITGLDRTPSALLVTSRYQSGDQSGGGSHVFRVNYFNGQLLGEVPFPGAPLACSRSYWQLSCCAYEDVPGAALGAGGRYWVGDVCGEIASFGWNNDIELGETFTLPGAPHPVSMVASGDTLFVLDDGHHWIIARYWKNGQCYTDTIPLDGGPPTPAAVAIWQDHFLVSGTAQQRLGPARLGWDYTLWEFTRTGQLVRTHALQSPRPSAPKNITVFGGQLYVACTSDSILVFEPTGLGIDVPGGDSIYVQAVPGRIEVLFDSVSSPGELFCDVLPSDSCPPPSGVSFFADFYDLRTTARFDYAAQVTVFTGEALPPGWLLKDLRVFARPSGDCHDYRDITAAPAEPVGPGPGFQSSIRTKSEDDEFSLFTLGRDLRTPLEVVQLKFDALDGAIGAGPDSIPPVVLAVIQRLAHDARHDYDRGRPDLAASRADSIAALVRATPIIPHTYDPLAPGHNLAGRLISYAHTLAFSLRFSESEAIGTAAVVVPAHFSQSPDGWVRVYLDVPEEFSETPQVDSHRIFLKHHVQAVPESVGVGDYLGNDGTQVKAVFSAAEVAAVSHLTGPTNEQITCFINGYEVYADVQVFGLDATPVVMFDGPLAAGSVQRITWDDTPCSGEAVSLWYSSDGGSSWGLVAKDISAPYYDWTVPPAETERGTLKIACNAADGSLATIVSAEFAIVSPAGVPAESSRAEPAFKVRPNPSASGFVFEVSSGGDRPIEITIYAVTGDLVKRLVASPTGSPTSAIAWQGDDMRGSRVSPGTYFAVVEIGGRTLTRKLVVRW
ncbi:MAG TPA: T9SS type A sorting domain-containing protein [bacterium]|nr:T9SS type A sorting domain-containing protein [bacterium]